MKLRRIVVSVPPPFDYTTRIHAQVGLGNQLVNYTMYADSCQLYTIVCCLSRLDRVQTLVPQQVN